MARVNGQSANSALTGFTGSILTLLDEVSRRIQRRLVGTSLRGGGRDHGRCRESGRYVRGQRWIVTYAFAGIYNVIFDILEKHSNVFGVGKRTDTYC